ncbi:beta-ketoacyl reductase, partial [Streptomyces sp. NPDC018031]|uniref:beta-ketoacyl reductase n=1 Tax=Streptomyces sp. NPDC018031 TaxID=3365033 RepID=UPI00379BA4BA
TTTLHDLTHLANPKTHTAWHLHHLTRHHPLTAFVLFSSGAGVWGGGGQGGYAAANAFLDALVAHRRGLGLPASSVAWGAWAGSGMSVADGRLAEGLVRRGVRGMDPESAVGALMGALDHDEASLTVTDMDWERFAEVFTAVRPSALLSGIPAVAAAVAPSGGGTGSGDGRIGGDGSGAAAEATDELRSRLAGLSVAGRTELLLDLVRAHAAAALGHSDPDAVSPEAGFLKSGFDSLTAVELRNRLRAATGLLLPTTLVFDYPNPAVLARHLLGELGAGGDEGAAGNGAGGVGVPAAGDRGEESRVRATLASIPVAKLRQAGLLDVLLGLADPGSRVVKPRWQGDSEAIDDLDVDSLIRIAMEES